MITVISGTNRKNAKTHIFARKYANLIEKSTDQKVNFFSLEDVPNDILSADMYSESGQSAEVATIQDKIMIPANKIVIIAPEYNGSYPGIVKLFLDACSIRNYKGTFSEKKFALIGIASGRAGNLRGLDHLSGIINHVGGIVYSNKLPISSIGSILSDDDEIDEKTIETMQKHADGFLAF